MEVTASETSSSISVMPRCQSLLIAPGTPT
jgi:hypothetical protein